MDPLTCLVKGISSNNFCFVPLLFHRQQKASLAQTTSGGGFLTFVIECLFMWCHWPVGFVPVTLWVLLSQGLKLGQEIW